MSTEGNGWYAQTVGRSVQHILLKDWSGTSFTSGKFGRSLDRSRDADTSYHGELHSCRYACACCCFFHRSGGRRNKEKWLVRATFPIRHLSRWRCQMLPSYDTWDGNWKLTDGNLYERRVFYCTARVELLSIGSNGLEFRVTLKFMTDFSWRFSF